MTKLLLDYGLVLLFLLIAMESAGVPLPGETALIAAAVLARPEHHHYSLFWVIVVAAAAAIVGDNDVKTLIRALEKLSAHVRPLRPGRIR